MIARAYALGLRNRGACGEAMEEKYVLDDALGLRKGRRKNRGVLDSG